MPKIELISERRVYDEYLKIDEGTVKETSDTGEEETYKRFALTRPDAVAVLIYNADTDKVILVKQHRYPVQVHGIDGDIYEIVAGKMDGDEAPSDTAIREAMEEVGYEIKEDKMIFMSEYFPSPGYSTEMIHLFAATVTNEDKKSDGGGVEGEHENINIIEVPAPEFFNMISTGEIVDGKTIMGANALWHLRNGQFVELGKRYYEILRMERAQQTAESVINEDTDADETTK